MFGPTSSRLASSGEWKSQKHKDAGAAISLPRFSAISRDCHAATVLQPPKKTKTLGPLHYHINFWPRFDLVIAQTGDPNKLTHCMQV